MSSGATPAGYVRISTGKRVAVVRIEHKGDALALLARGSIYEVASRRPEARHLAGRGVAYAIELPETKVRAVVRHNRHGGLFAPITRDLFLEHTRAPFELKAALRLEVAKVPTPQILMYAEERVAGLWKRADVVTREVDYSRDLSTYMLPGENAHLRRQAWEATSRLLWRLSAVGARHHDLNVKNILLSPGAAEGDFKAWILDVDRVQFFRRQSPKVLNGNLLRLFRSARKWRDKHGAVFEEKEMNSLLRRTMP